MVAAWQLKSVDRLRLATEQAKSDATCSEEMLGLSALKQPRYLSREAYLTTTPFVLLQNMFRMSSFKVPSEKERERERERHIERERER